MKRSALRIAMICMHSSPIGELGTRDTGGMSVYVREVARRLGAAGHAVDIFTRLQHPGAPEVIRPFENVRIAHLPAGPPGPLPLAVLQLHVDEFFQNLERFRKAEGIDYDLAHSHYCLSGLVGLLARKRWRAPLALMFHTLGALKNRAAASPGEPAPRIVAENRLALESDLILAATEREKRYLVESYGAAPEKIHVVPCGVDMEKFRPAGRSAARARLGFGPEEPVILYVGRFDPIKGIDRLLTAASLLRRELRPRVVLVGGGENVSEERRLRALCSELSLSDCVTFAGRKAHDALPDYYRAADVFVLPSHYESFGLVVLEALACGAPVVAMRVGVVEEVVRSGVNGWVVEENAPERLAEGVRRALEAVSNREMSVESIRATVGGYDWGSVAGSIDAKYRALLERESGAGDLFASPRRARGHKG